MTKTSVPQGPKRYLYLGMAITRSDLPAPGCRWTATRKTILVGLVEKGELTLAELYDRYPDLSETEFETWQRRIAEGGLEGLLAKNIS